MIARALLYLLISVGVLQTGRSVDTFEEKSVAELIQVLKNPDATKRKAAAYELSGRNPKATGAIPAILEALKDEDTDVRVAAAWAIWRIDNRTDTAVPVLIAAMNDVKYDARINVPTMIDLMKPKADAVVPAYIALTKDRDASMRTHACVSLGNYQEKAADSMPFVFACLKDVDPLVRGNAAVVMVALGKKDEKLKRALQEMFKNDTDGLARAQGALAYWRLDGRPAEVVPVLMKELESGKSMAPIVALAGLTEIGPDARPAVPLLLKRYREVNDGKPDPRDNDFARGANCAALLRALGRIADNRPLVLDVVRSGLADKNPKVRTEAAAASWRLEHAPERVLPILLQALEGRENMHVALEALGDMGPAAKAAIPRLEKLSEQGDKAVRTAATKALQRIRTPPEK